MTKVTASEFQKNFGQYKEIAQREPVSVTSNGRESVVLLSATEYKAYQEYKMSRYIHNAEVTGQFAEDLDHFMDRHADVLTELAK